MPPGTGVRLCKAFRLPVSTRRLDKLHEKHPCLPLGRKGSSLFIGAGGPKPRVVTRADGSGAKGCWDRALKSAASRSPSWPLKSCCCFTEHFCTSVLCSAGSVQSRC